MLKKGRENNQIIKKNENKATSPENNVIEEISKVNQQQSKPTSTQRRIGLYRAKAWQQYNTGYIQTYRLYVSTYRRLNQLISSPKIRF